MFEKIIDLMKKKNDPAFDASIFNDPIAVDVGWTPLSSGGSSFKTHNLVQSGINRIEFKAGAGMIIFLSMFIFFGLSFAGIAPFIILTDGGDDRWVAILPFLFGIVFVFIGYIIYRTGGSPRVFDKTSGFYWKGRREPNQMLNQAYQNYIKLSDIHAVQILSEFVRTSKSSFTSYELNLVMIDRTRINVVDHGNLEVLRSDAAILAGFLNVKVWDATL